MMDRKKIIQYSVSAGLLLVVIAGIYLFVVARSVAYSGKLSAEVTAGTEIIRGQYGYPLIRADSWNDAYIAMGYAHAQDRLLLIEYQRALANGRLSELTGRDSLMMDKLSRIMGFSQRAADIVPGISPVYSSRLDSYVKGINLFKRNKYQEIVQLSNVSDEKWTVQDVVAILLMHEWTQGYLNNKELVFAFSEGLSGYQLKDVFPEDLVYYYSDAEQKNVFALKELKKIVQAFAGQGPSGLAASIPGSRTADGKAKLLYNFDSSTSQFPAYYPLSVKIGDETVEGITLAGQPFFIAAKNDAVTFAGFTLKTDSQDFYLEETRSADGEDQYLSQGIWKKFETRTERILLGKNRKAEVAEIEIRITDRGPVISDAFRGMFKTDVISTRAVLPDESFIAALFEIPLAKSLVKARQSAANINSMPRLYLFTERDNALIQYSGKLPVRGFPDRILKKETPWQGAMDLSAYSTFRNNESMVAGDAIFENEPPFMRNYIQFNDISRASRLRELVDAGHNLDDSEIKGILLDVYSTTASKFIPVIMPVLQKIPITSARLCRMYFSDWDFRMTKGSVPASVFQAILVKMMRETLSDEFKNEIDDVIENHYFFAEKFYEAFAADKSLIFDDVTTKEKIEYRDMIFDRAFLKSMRFLNQHRGPIMEDWEWGSLHSGKLSIPLMKSTFISRRLSAAKDGPISGSSSTLHRSTFRVNGGFRVNELTVLSGVFDAEMALVNPFFGCSMNPSSEYFDLYREKRKFTPIVSSAAVHTLTLVPKK